ncbi:sensor histidine kinase [Spirosoma utsteinense]|uniref:histidine kinase n=1 Tax=Spirosoma utsteinense TaxID=2585773 RepID=A0ABR6WBI1_9BACT|nr:sensor histidine kinase [Spirosoma utsteinense]MBC3785262.1 signal transduction histidine kinase [Spirosoma utsteinense]MBC3793934.1 signal transduction histidine kinase [Spirosoma utsteinense]
MNLANQFRTVTANRRIALSFSVALVLIVSGFSISFYSYNEYGQDTERVRHTYRVISALESTLSLVKDIETGARGFVITNDSVYLEPYLKALTLLPAQLKNVHELTTDNYLQEKRANLLEKLVMDKVDITRLRAKTKLADVRNGLTYSDEGKRRMDKLRGHVAMMVDTEKVLMETRNRQASRSFRNTLIIIFALSLMTFLALAMSYRQLEQELVRRQETENQLRSYEARLKEQIRQLEASNQELERFAFVASHDLQEPLRKIQSFATLVTERYGNLFNSDSQVFMSKIISSAERMSKLIKDLLNFSRMSSNREDFKPVRLDTIIQHILDDQELRIKGLGVQVEVGALPMIQAVPSQLEHLFANLISNALKFLRPGVQPLLRIQARPVDGHAYAELTGGRRYVEITVEDNGIGFDEKYLDYIFKVFQRLHGKSEFEGTGIGLAICKRVVVYHHGFITAHSQPNEGTTFVVVLPESQLLQDYDRSNSTETHTYSAG